MPQTVLSPSTISLCQECERCFWLRINKGIKRPEGIFPSLPGGMDKILKEHFDSHREESTIPEELEGFDGKLFPDTEKLRAWRNNREGLRYRDEKTGIVLMGAIDDLFVTKEGLYAPLDFKTRGYPRKENTHEFYQNQMDIYAFLLEKNGLPTPGFAIIIFYHPTCVNGHCNVEFHPDPLKMTINPNNGEQLFRKAIEILRGPEPKSNPDCPYCNWGR
jgi:hypothetical protein